MARLRSQGAGHAAERAGPTMPASRGGARRPRRTVRGSTPCPTCCHCPGWRWRAAGSAARRGIPRGRWRSASSTSPTSNARHHCRHLSAGHLPSRTARDGTSRTAYDRDPRSPAPGRRMRHTSTLPDFGAPSASSQSSPTCRTGRGVDERHRAASPTAAPAVRRSIDGAPKRRHGPAIVVLIDGVRGRGPSAGARRL